MTGLGWTTQMKRVKCPKCNKVQLKEWYALFVSKPENPCRCECGELLTTANIKKNKLNNPKSTTSQRK